MSTCAACAAGAFAASERCVECGRSRDVAAAAAPSAAAAAAPSAPSAALAGVPEVLVDADGVFKYVQIRVAGAGGARLLVRGHAWAKFHDDVFQHYRADLLALPGVTAVECVGGGRIAVDAGPRRARVYGHSVGYGRCEHALTAAALARALPGYDITHDNEGY